MDERNRPLRYLPDKIIYSVGQNGTDDGGSSKLRPNHLQRKQFQYTGWPRWTSRIIFLS